MNSPIQWVLTIDIDMIGANKAEHHACRAGKNPAMIYYGYDDLFNAGSMYYAYNTHLQNSIFINACMYILLLLW